MGHSDLNTTLIDTNVLKRGPMASSAQLTSCSSPYKRMPGPKTTVHSEQISSKTSTIGKLGLYCRRYFTECSSGG
jgi:hypothetical protein